MRTGINRDVMTWAPIGNLAHSHLRVCRAYRMAATSSAGESEWASTREDGEYLVLCLDGDKEAKHRRVAIFNCISLHTS